MLRSTVGRQFTLIAFFAIAGMSCAEDPTSVGLDILPDSDLPVFVVDTLEVSSMYSSPATILTARSDGTVSNWIPTTLFLGGVQQLKSGMFVKFNAIPESLQGVSVTGADLLLYQQSFVGDSNATVSFTIHRGLTSWIGDSLTYDSLDMLPGVYFDQAPLPPGVGASSTDSGFVVIPLDTALVTQWLVSTVDSGNGNQGVFLNPTSNDVIRGYFSFLGSSVSQPRLRIQYLKAGIPGSTVFSVGLARYLASLPAINVPPQTAQAGVAYRNIQNFDMTVLPKPVSVNDARLELTLDSASSMMTGFGKDSLYAFFVLDDGTIDKSSRTVGTPSYVNGIKTYSFSINSIVRVWLHQTQATLAITAFAENYSMDRFVIYGPTEPEGRRPRLIVTYSQVRTGTTAGGAR